MSGYYVDQRGVEYTYTEGKLNFNDWVNEIPEVRSRMKSIETENEMIRLHMDWEEYAEATPIGISGFEKGYTQNQR